MRMRYHYYRIVNIVVGLTVATYPRQRHQHLGLTTSVVRVCEVEETRQIFDSRKSLSGTFVASVASNADPHQIKQAKAMTFNFSRHSHLLRQIRASSL